MLRAGDLIDGRYVVRDLLGRGGMAEVHRVTDLVDGRAYAVKVMRGAEPGLEDRFRREVAALARLDHPGLVRLHRAGAHRGDGYLLLDLADGPPLSQALSDGPAGFDRTVALGQQVAAALAHVHRAGLVHRDVKPSNILLHRDRALLADFGIARLPGAPALTLTGQVIGSAPYLAPEQVEGELAGPPADVYALGLVLIECLTGARCYPGTYVESAIARLHHAPEIPAVPAWLRDVLVAMTARQPTRRPPAGAVAEALARRDSAGAVGATVPLALTPDSAPQRGGGGRDVRPSPRVRRGRPRSGRRVGARALAAAAAVLVTLGWTVIGGDPPSQPAVTQPTTPPTTAPAPAADPARPTSAAESPQGGREDRADRTAVQEVDATSVPVLDAAEGPGAASRDADVRPAAPDPGLPPVEDVDVPPTTTPPTTATTAPSPPGTGDGNGNGNGNGSGGTGDDDGVPSDPTLPGGEVDG